ncbi:MAG: hypothetical protein GXO89_00180 [Chlorobi bacterium]|nr:hypothetical protein [Chlorobiota bacterium]
MKKVNKSLLVFFLFLGISLNAQPTQLTWEFKNVSIISPGGGALDSLRFEVWISADMPGSYFGISSIAIEYPESVFGSFIADPNLNNLSLQRGNFLQQNLGGIYNYNILGTTNFSPQILTTIIQPAFSFPPFPVPYGIIEIPTTPTQFMIFTAAIQDRCGTGQMIFNADLMNGSQECIPDCSFADPNIYVQDEMVSFPIGICSSSWTGAIDNDWFDMGNWAEGTIPSEQMTANIPSGTPNEPLIASSVARCKDLTIETGAVLQISSDGALTATGTIYNDGHIIMIGENTGASLIENGLEGTGTFEYQQYLHPGPEMSHLGWHFVSSPVNNTVSGDFTGYWLKEWNETTGSYNAMDIENSDCPGSLFTVPLTPGKGYFAKQNLGYVDDCPIPTGSTGDYVEFGGDFMGGYPTHPTSMATMDNVNTGAVSVSITAGNSNWNLLGNPYPSGLDWDLAAIPSGLNNAIYFWDEDMEQYAAYSNGIGVNGGTNVIPPTQGFLVEANGTQPEFYLSFHNYMRVHGTTSYFKDTDPANKILRLKAMANAYSDETVIRFSEDASVGWDKQYDAKKLFSGKTETPSIYSLSEQDMLSLNSLPAIDNVPLAFACGVSGTYSIEILETDDFPVVVLEDVFTGKTTDLLSGHYTFDYVKGEDSDRFILHFGAMGTTESDMVPNIQIWSFQNKVFVDVQNISKGEIIVLNILGQEVGRKYISQGINSLSVNSTNSYYIVKVVGDKALKTGKVFIK